MVTAIAYFIMGILFTYMAVQSVEDTVWNFTTVLLTIIAALDFGVGIRFLENYLVSKRNNS